MNIWTDIKEKNLMKMKYHLPFDHISRYLSKQVLTASTDIISPSNMMHLLNYVLEFTKQRFRLRFVRGSRICCMWRFVRGQYLSILNFIPVRCSAFCRAENSTISRFTISSGTDSDSLTTLLKLDYIAMEFKANSGTRTN